MTVSLLLSSFAKADNEIILENVFDSDNLNLSITQVGANNTIDCYQINSCDVDGNNVLSQSRITRELFLLNAIATIWIML